jgi:hypothetical protein
MYFPKRLLYIEQVFFEKIMHLEDNHAVNCVLHLCENVKYKHMFERFIACSAQLLPLSKEIMGCRLS